MKAARFRRLVGGTALFIIAVELVLVLSGVLDFGKAVRFALIMEICLAGLVVFEVAVVLGAVRRARQLGDDLPFALDGALAEFFPAAVASYVRQDLMLVRAIWMLLSGRRDVRPGEVALPYSGALVPVLLAVCFGDVVAAALLHLLLPESWRTAALVVAVIGLVWLLGFVASLICYPHVVSPERLRLRFAAFQDICIPASAVTRVSTTRREPPTQKAAEIVGAELGMAVSGQADVVVDLADTTVIRSLNRKLAAAEIARATFHATDSQRAATAIRDRIGAGDPT